MLDSQKITCIKGDGFSLIELMIVIVVIGVITVIGVPTYQQSVIKGDRTIGKSALVETLSRQEQYFIHNKSYATGLTNLGYPAITYYIDRNGKTSTNASGSIYLIRLANGATTRQFTLEAVPQNRQADDTYCGTYGLTDSGVKTVTGSSGITTCW